jgi:hypothetical protein
VAAAIRAAAIPSAQFHFDTIGGEELRAPSLAYLEDTTAWARACGKI